MPPLWDTLEPLVHAKVEKGAQKLQTAALPQEECAQRVLERRGIFRKFQFYANASHGKTIGIGGMTKKRGHALFSIHAIIKRHVAHIR